MTNLENKMDNNVVLTIWDICDNVDSGSLKLSDLFIYFLCLVVILLYMF